MDLAHKVRLRREQLGWTQDELARRMGYASRVSINKIENGRPVSQKIIARLADALNTTVPWLMGWAEEIEKDPVGTAERHFEMIMDEDISEIFEDFKRLDSAQKKIVKDLVHSLAETKKSEA